MAALEQEEQALLESVENGEWQSIKNVKPAIQRYQGYAHSQLSTWTAIQDELPDHDLQSLQLLAQEMGTSVPQLVVSIIRQYLDRQSSTLEVTRGID